MALTRRNLMASLSAAGAAACVSTTGVAADGDRAAPSGMSRANASGGPSAELAHFGPKKPAEGSQGLVISGHPEASRIAVDVLREGGNACDALLAAAISQTVFEPHLTTLTGCFSMMYHEAATGETHYLNGNVNAPLAPLEGLSEADVTSGRMVAVPGYWAGFEAAHGAFATMPLSRLMKPAIRAARDGVAYDPFLWTELFSAQSVIGRSEEGRRIFMPDRAIPAPGDTLRQPEAADFLERLQGEGSSYFYHGAFADRFCKIVGRAGGVITPEDFARYEVRWDKPVRGTYRDIDIVGSPAPDVGGVHLIELMNLIEQAGTASMGPASESPEALVAMMLAAREVLIAGAAYNDPKYVDLPVDQILSKEYAAARWKRISTTGVRPVSVTAPPPGSCHLTVVDADGNIATALHSTLSIPWVNGLFINGVSICGAGNHFLRTLPPPGARVSVLICPSILFRNGKPVIAGGSPSTSLLANLVQNITNIVDFGMSVDESVRRPTFGGLADNQGALSIEADIGEAHLKAVRRAGLSVELLNPWNFRHGAFEAICFENGVARACGDPRRTSSAMAA